MLKLSRTTCSFTRSSASKVRLRQPVLVQKMATAEASTSAMQTEDKQVPEGYTVHRESTTEVLLASGRDVFINPIQEFNRDISTLAIRTWSKVLDSEKKQNWLRKQENIKAKGKKRKNEGENNGELEADQDVQQPVKEYSPYSFTLFEGLSATGLRSIRYAKEIPNLKWVLANDLSPQAAANIQKNVEWNDLAGDPVIAETEASVNRELDQAKQSGGTRSAQAKVRVSQGDCCSVLYAHRAPGQHFDVIDLDPYGTAAPFLDGAVQAVNDGGLLCVTCTDLAVLAGGNYAEKCYSNYGGSPIKAEYTHEGALRILLHAIASSGARYGRHIKPLLSLSIDYYIRVFVRVRTGAAEVKNLPSRTSLVYVCHQCQAFHLQNMGKATMKEDNKGTPRPNYNLASGPPTSPRCEHCQGVFSVAGPMWTGSLHEPSFVADMLEEVRSMTLKTTDRIKGMLTVAQKELDQPFYFTPGRVASNFHATCPPIITAASALLNGGYKVSRSHACAGSLKTDAPYSFILDIVRKWIESNPVTMANIKEGSPARLLLASPATHEVDLSHNRAAGSAILSDLKIVRYQQNPTANWGPQARAGQKKAKTQ